MANRNFPNGGKSYNFHAAPVIVDCQVNIGASGAVSSISGSPGVASVTKLATGLYQLTLKDGYFSCQQFDCAVVSPPTGSAVASGSFVTGTPYTITTLGTTNYKLIGLNAALTPAIGQAFVATGAGTGNGTATAIGNSGIASVEQLANPQSMINLPNQGSSAASTGGIILFQTLAATSSGVTTSIPSNPVNGSQLKIMIALNNSSVQ